MSEPPSTYQDLVEKLVDEITLLRAQDRDRPVLVSVNGQWGVGKSWLVRRWVAALQSRGISTETIKRDWYIRDLEIRRGELEDYRSNRMRELPGDTRISEFNSLLVIAKEFAGNPTIQALTVDLAGLYDDRTGITDVTKTLRFSKNSIMFFETGYTSAGANFEVFDLRVYITDSAEARKQRIKHRYGETGRSIPDNFDFLFKKNLTEFANRLSNGSVMGDLFIYMDGFRAPSLISNPEPRNCTAFVSYLEAHDLLDAVRGFR